MAEKLFITGLPGSGKSAIARHVEGYLVEKGWATRRFNDYGILHAMFEHPVEGRLFKPAESDGFNVIDISAFDTALQRLETEITDYLSFKAKAQEIILIEFARNDYWRAFKQFSRSFLHDAFFIYLDVTVDVCKERIRERIANPLCEDDYSVSDYIFERYYHSDDGRELDINLREVFGVDEKRLLNFNNNCTLQMAIEKTNPFIDAIIKYAPMHDEAVASQDISLASMFG
jgi:adenylate kinase family enzyme